MNAERELPIPTNASEGQSPRQVVLFWEKLRVVFVLLAVFPAWGVYSLRTRVSNGVGDTRYLGEWQVALLFFVAFILLNLCFSSVYALEFFFRSSKFWGRRVRIITFIVGALLGIVLATLAARDIGGAAYSPTWISSKPR